MISVSGIRWSNISKPSQARISTNTISKKETANNRAVIYFLQGDVEKARDLWEQLLALFPRDEDIKNNLQITQVQINRPREDIDWLADEDEVGQKGFDVGPALKDLQWKKEFE